MSECILPRRRPELLKLSTRPSLNVLNILKKGSVAPLKLGVAAELAGTGGGAPTQHFKRGCPCKFGINEASDTNQVIPNITRRQYIVHLVS
jgi:hypothetical protein